MASGVADASFCRLPTMPLAASELPPSIVVKFVTYPSIAWLYSRPEETMPFAALSTDPAADLIALAARSDITPLRIVHPLDDFWASSPASFAAIPSFCSAFCAGLIAVDTASDTLPLSVLHALEIFAAFSPAACAASPSFCSDCCAPPAAADAMSASLPFTLPQAPDVYVAMRLDSLAADCSLDSALSSLAHPLTDSFALSPDSPAAAPASFASASSRVSCWRVASISRW